MVFMRNYVQIASLGLLVAVLAVLTPKELYHHCEHESHQTSDDKASFVPSDDCSICEFQLLPYSLGSITFQPLEEVNFVPGNLSLSTRPYISPILHFDSRGPPAQAA